MNLKKTIITAAAIIGAYAGMDLIFPKDHSITYRINELHKEHRLERILHHRQELTNGDQIPSSTYDKNISWTTEFYDIKTQYFLKDKNSIDKKERIFGSTYQNTIAKCYVPFGYGMSRDFNCKNLEKTINSIYVEQTKINIAASNESSLNSWYAKNQGIDKKDLAKIRLTIDSRYPNKHCFRSALKESVIGFCEFKWDTINACLARLEDSGQQSLTNYKDIGIIVFDNTGHYIENVPKNPNLRSIAKEYFRDFLIDESIADEKTKDCISFKILKPSSKQSSIPYAELDEESQKFVIGEYEKMLNSGIIDSLKYSNKQIIQDRMMDEEKEKRREQEEIQKKKEQEYAKKKEEYDKKNSDIQEIVQKYR